MNFRSDARVSVAVFVSLILVGLLLSPAIGRAYEMTGGGGKLGYTSPDGLDGTVMVGGHLEWENATRLSLVPNLMYWKVDQVSDVNPNMDVCYRFDRRDHASPYLGGGVGLDVRDSDRPNESGTTLNANFIGGVTFPNGSNHYFVEGRFTASDVPRVALLGGITFHAR